MSFQTEQEINSFWQDNNIVQKQTDQNKDNQQFVFYDGPPFASGNPHFGHVLAGTIKDVVTRYHSLRGDNVRRVWGWDTHGVPIESKANKELNITCKEDVLKMGIGEYNKQCRKYVMSCQDKWKQVTSKLGRWIDMDNSYKTMDESFMNSVWYIFSQLFKKNLIYHGVKIMSYSPGLECPLSNNEANLNYIAVNDPSLTLQFPVKFENQDVNILVWTTTPWTLACNLLLCVHPDLEYSLVMCENKTYVLLSNQVKDFFKKKKVKTLKTVFGKDLVGIQYEPLFDFYKDFKPANPNSKPFHIVADTMVSGESGTGIVHIAPGFGQDDKNVSEAYGLTSDEVLPPCPLDDECKYTEPVATMDIFNDKFCKDSDKDVVKYLKSKDSVFKMEYKLHDYPHCYRTDRPLIYRTYPAWFLKVKDHSQKIKDNLKQTNWVPSYVRDNKYMEMLECVPDWCISRNRFWGTPLPVWTNGDETVVVESARQLEELANLEVNSIKDLHPEFIFDIKIPSAKPNGKPLENVNLVLDCWFESGSMPFGQWGYPYNPEVKLDDIFPADFIAEGTDQTRGWFHALMVLYTLLFDKPPFKNVIVNGIVQSKVVDGKGKKTGKWAKMSKKDGNYSDPEDVIDQQGADTLRLFLIKSAGVRAGDVPFDTKSFKTIHKNYYIMIQNMITFWKQSLEIYKNTYSKPSPLKTISEVESDMSLVDIWIIQEFNQILGQMNKEYQDFQLYFLTDHIDRAIDKISRWYIKLNKKPLKGETSQVEFETAISVLTHVLHHLILMMAPITPFMSESFYLYMKQQINVGYLEDNELYQKESIHLHTIVDELKLKNNNNLLDGMELFIRVLEITRQFRAEYNRPHKMPLKEVTIAFDNMETMEQLKSLSSYLKQEVNSDFIKFYNDPFNFITLKYKLNRTIIGKKYKKDAKLIVNHLEGMNITESWFDPNPAKVFNWRYFRLPTGTNVEIEKEYFDSYVEIKPEMVTDNLVVMNQDKLVMVFNMEVSDEMKDIYYINCLAREIQEMRKEASLTPSDHVSITYVKNDKIKDIMKNEKHEEYLTGIIHQKIHEYDEMMDMKPFYTRERVVGDYKLVINFHR